MNKKVFGKKFSRDSSSRRALFRSLIRALVSYGSINTTEAKAKAIIGEVDKIVTLVKKGGVSSKRRVYAILGNDRTTADRLFNEVVPVFVNRRSGYTRIIKLPRRLGDNARLARIEWTDKIGTSSTQHAERSKEKKVSNSKSGKKEIKRPESKKSKK